MVDGFLSGVFGHGLRREMGGEAFFLGNLVPVRGAAFLAADGEDSAELGRMVSITFRVVREDVAYLVDCGCDVAVFGLDGREFARVDEDVTVASDSPASGPGAGSGKTCPGGRRTAAKRENVGGFTGRGCAVRILARAASKDAVGCVPGAVSRHPGEGRGDEGSPEGGTFGIHRL